MGVSGFVVARFDGEGEILWSVPSGFATAVAIDDASDVIVVRNDGDDVASVAKLAGG